MTPSRAARPLLALSLLAPLLAAGPAAAQESARPEVCPNVSFVEQPPGPPGSAVTYRFGSDVQPARTPDGWVLTRLSPGPTEVVDTAPAATSTAFTVAPEVTTAYRVTALGPDGCDDASAEFTRTVTSPGEGAPPGSYAASCPGIVGVVVRPEVGTSGRTVELEVRLTSPTSRNTVTLTRVDPAPAQVVRQSSADLWVTFRVRLGESHRFTARVTRDDRTGCTDVGNAQTVSVLVPVQAAVTIGAVRNGPRDYVFRGRVMPAYGMVALYRVTDDGRRVLTARADVRPDGTYRIDRRFLGSGRFGFVVVADAASTGRYAGGESAVRPTVVH